MKYAILVLSNNAVNVKVTDSIYLIIASILLVIGVLIIISSIIFIILSLFGKTDLCDALFYFMVGLLLIIVGAGIISFYLVGLQSPLNNFL